MSRCSWTADGVQCEFPGTLSHGLKGEGRWMCPFHFRTPDQAQGSEIVERSQRWALLPNKAEAWIDMRRKQVYGNGENANVRELRERMARRAAGETVNIASSKLDREPGADESES